MYCLVRLQRRLKLKARDDFLNAKTENLVKISTVNFFVAGVYRLTFAAQPLIKYHTLLHYYYRHLKKFKMGKG